MIVMKTTINPLIDLRKMVLEGAYAREAPKAKKNYQGLSFNLPNLKELATRLQRFVSHRQKLPRRLKIKQMPKILCDKIVT